MDEEVSFYLMITSLLEVDTCFPYHILYGLNAIFCQRKGEAGQEKVLAETKEVK